ncbi:hypothetical protein [Pseudomonas sp. zfem002]|uniref:hypothetical protein n=1 Tax=Pseudomonas sp. zfem002 TaxID=3078197 RepID=UPI002927F3C8|nr:hypothetical protein [Pseudomonas sp. zfem002]MDU9393299.1 hypothetical protein [Pseudomonas sp. zfem002]
MPVDLHELPEKLNPPPPPGTLRWLLLILLFTAAGAAVVLLFWPGELQPRSPWFWSCVLLFPLSGAVILFGLRLFAHENRETYVDSWNAARADVEAELTAQGRQAIALLATSYCTPVGSEKFAAKLRGGDKPLQTIFLPVSSTTLRWSPLVDEDPKVAEDCSQRLQGFLDRLLASPDVDLNRLFPGQPVRVRIRHNQVLTDDKVLAIWASCAQRQMLKTETVSVAAQDDGVLWLDDWLDQPKAFPLLLSVEFNLFTKPVAEQAESVSVVLLARSEYCRDKDLQPAAWIHRPLAMSCDPHSVGDVLLWGSVSEDCPLFAWQAQVPTDRLRELSMALGNQGHPLDRQASLRLDDTLGAPGCAVGNIALILGSEQAAADQQPQLLMLQDATPQWCVVRPAP